MRCGDAEGSRPHVSEFGCQMIELVRSGRMPFGAIARARIDGAGDPDLRSPDRSHVGRRQDDAMGSGRALLTRLRRENRQLVSVRCCLGKEALASQGMRLGRWRLSSRVGETE